MSTTFTWTLAGALIAVAVALQFVPLYHARLAALARRAPLLFKMLNARTFQLGAGFALFSLAVELLR